MTAAECRVAFIQSIKTVRFTFRVHEYVPTYRKMKLHKTLVNTGQVRVTLAHYGFCTIEASQTK